MVNNVSIKRKKEEIIFEIAMILISSMLVGQICPISTGFSMKKRKAADYERRQSCGILGLD